MCAVRKFVRIKRICMFVDHSKSLSMRTFVSDFVQYFELLVRPCWNENKLPVGGKATTPCCVVKRRGTREKHGTKRCQDGEMKIASDIIGRCNYYPICWLLASIVALLCAGSLVYQVWLLSSRPTTGNVPTHIRLLPLRTVWWRHQKIERTQNGVGGSWNA